MKKLFFLFGFIMLFDMSYSQGGKQPETKHYYYVNFQNIDTKQQYLDIKQLLLKHKEVTYAEGNDFPAEYFRIESYIELNTNTLNSWVLPNYKVDYIGEGDYGREQALKFYQSKKKSGTK